MNSCSKAGFIASSINSSRDFSMTNPFFRCSRSKTIHCRGFWLSKRITTWCEIQDFGSETGESPVGKSYGWNLMNPMHTSIMEIPRDEYEPTIIYHLSMPRLAWYSNTLNLRDPLNKWCYKNQAFHKKTYLETTGSLGADLEADAHFSQQLRADLHWETLVVPGRGAVAPWPLK